MFLFRKKKKEKSGKDNNGISPTVAPSVQGMSYNVGNLQGIGARNRQEDSFSIINAFNPEKIHTEGLLFLVCDGMGGMKDGKLASETAVASIRDSFRQMNREADIAEQLKNSVYVASERVEELLDGQGGSTVVAGIILKEKFYYVSVGDSYLYLKRGENLYRLNQEHNVCNQIFLSCIRDGYMDPREGRQDSESVALTQFLGMTGLSEVDGFVRPLSLKAGDVLLACSDGVGGMLDEAEVLESLTKMTPQEMCTNIEEKIIFYNTRNQDNYTAVVVQCVK